MSVCVPAIYLDRFGIYLIYLNPQSSDELANRKYEYRLQCECGRHSFNEFPHMGYWILTMRLRKLNTIYLSIKIDSAIQLTRINTHKNRGNQNRVPEQIKYEL